MVGGGEALRSPGWHSTTEFWGLNSWSHVAQQIPLPVSPSHCLKKSPLRQDPSWRQRQEDNSECEASMVYKQDCFKTPNQPTNPNPRPSPDHLCLKYAAWGSPAGRGGPLVFCEWWALPAFLGVPCSIPSSKHFLIPLWPIIAVWDVYGKWKSLFQTWVNTGSEECNDTWKLHNLILKQNKEFLCSGPLSPGLEVANSCIFYWGDYSAKVRFCGKGDQLAMPAVSQERYKWRATGLVLTAPTYRNFSKVMISACMWRSSAFSFYHVGPKDQTEAIRCGGK